MIGRLSARIAVPSIGLGAVSIPAGPALGQSTDQLEDLQLILQRMSVLHSMMEGVFVHANHDIECSL